MADRRGVALATVFAAGLLLLLVGGSANAAGLSLTGEWFQNRGPLVDIPINGGPGLCFGDASTGCVRQAGAPVGFRPFGGGIPGSGVATVNGNAPAGFTIPPGLFGQALGKQSAPVTIIPTVVQLATTFTLQGPAAPGALGVPTAAQPAQFMANAWSQDPGQAARAAANFNWCPGVGGPSCAGIGSGTAPAIVRYTAGANAFGGTMAMMIKGQGTVSITRQLGSVTTVLAHQPVGGGTVFNPQHPGRGYATTDTDALLAAPIYAFWTIPIACTNAPGFPPSPPGCGLIGFQSGPAGSFPADQNLNWGFPWTTGTVQVQNIENTIGGSPSNTTMTARGTDNRTSFGVGRITLVAGGTTKRLGAGLNFAAIDVVNMTFSSPVPSGSPMGYVVLVLLMMLTAGFFFRRRLVGATH